MQIEEFRFKRNDSFTMYKLIDFFATFAYSGYSPKAPGTMGSLAALIPIILMVLYLPSDLYMIVLLIGIAIACFGGIAASNVIVRKEKLKDPQRIVIDEVAGQFITFLLVPQIWLQNNIWALLLGFAFFRLFDITKILGIKKLEDLPDGWGVVCDDVLGGVYAAISLFLVYRYFA